jgi:serine/threonine-protein kinase
MAAFQNQRTCPRDGVPTRVDIGDPLVGAVLGERYRIIDRRASGAMGQVYQAAHTRMASVFAVKVLFGDLAYDEEMRTRFAREAEIASLLQSRHIVRVVDFSQSDLGLLYLAMEYLDGDSLTDVIQRHGRIDAPRALHITRQIARGLSHAHERGVVHRDLKSDNVILVREDDEHDVAKILDFGVARLRNDVRLTQAGAIIGTPAYMAPEQIMSGEIDARADQYALGVTLYEMLTGQLPYEFTNLMSLVHMQTNGARKPITAFLPATPYIQAVDQLLSRLLSARAQDRFESARDVVNAINALPAPHSVPRIPVVSIVPAANPSSPNGLSAQPPVDPALLEAIRRAIMHGAPTYNEGNHAGCYQIYRDTADEQLRTRAGILGPATVARLSVALARAESAGSPTLRAWTMRHAFDDLLGAQPVNRDAPRDAVDQAIDAFSSVIERVYAQGHDDALAPYHLAFAAQLRELLARTPSRAQELDAFDQAVRAASAGAPDACAGLVTQALERLRVPKARSAEYSSQNTTIGPPVTRLDPAAREAILRAIRIGVPAYNSGDHLACAREYMRTADIVAQESRKSAETQLLASWLDGVLQHARGCNAHDAAWAVRRAFDALLSLP